ncbi:hypothetical protein [Glaciihabitans sp. GrIS 2.15]|uniref:hypothetical protein n=1 Tax=Glaciihabitans sp. GrIS 2.15 TaxID=3071710 RepID=UPI002E138BCB
MARPLAIAAIQLKSVALDASIEQSGIPPAAGLTTTLPPTTFVPVRRTALVGENGGALKLKSEVGLIGLVGAGDGVGSPLAVGSATALVLALVLVLVLVLAGDGVPELSSGIAAAPISVIVWIANPAMATAAPSRRYMLRRRVTLAPRSRNGRRGTFEGEGCTVTPFSTSSPPVSIICAW